MKTSVDGQRAKWTPEIRAKWDSFCARQTPPLRSSGVNYFSPRPYQDPRYQGGLEEGFTYMTGAAEAPVGMFVIRDGIYKLPTPPRKRR